MNAGIIVVRVAQGAQSTATERDELYNKKMPKPMVSIFFSEEWLAYLEEVAS